MRWDKITKTANSPSERKAAATAAAARRRQLRKCDDGRRRPPFTTATADAAAAFFGSPFLPSFPLPYSPSLSLLVIIAHCTAARARRQTQ